MSTQNTHTKTPDGLVGSGALVAHNGQFPTIEYWPGSTKARRYALHGWGPSEWSPLDSAFAEEMRVAAWNALVLANIGHEPRAGDALTPKK